MIPWGGLNAYPFYFFLKGGITVRMSISAQSAAQITPNDTTVFSTVRGIYLGASGNLKVDMSDGATVTFTALSAGVIHPIAARKIYATGTTATGIVGLY